MYKIHHVLDTILVLTNDFTDRFRGTSHAGQHRWMRSPFPNAQTVLRLLPIILPLASKGLSQRTCSAMSMRPIWKRYSNGKLDALASLYLDVMSVSLIENAYDEEQDFYLHIGTKKSRRFDGWTLRRIREFMLGVRDSQGRLGNSETEKGELNTFCTLDSRSVYGNFDRMHWNTISPQVPLGKYNHHLVSASKGQVSYMSFLETLSLETQCVNMYRVFPGSLLYEGTKYAYIQAENLTDFGGFFDSPIAVTERSTVHTILSDSTKWKSSWSCTVQDNHLNLCYVPRCYSRYDYLSNFIL